MRPYYEQSGVTIFHGNSIDVLRQMPDESVNCCITSPPYWGLRDYGTGEWAGGLQDCDHIYNHGGQGPSGQRASRTFTAQSVYREECGKCGASRIDDQIGLERTPEEYVARLVDVFREVRRILRDDGTLWVNCGDSYSSGGNGGHQKGESFHGHDDREGDRTGIAKKPPPGFKPKDMIGMPWRIAFALHTDGWYLRSDIIWHKPNPQPESVSDRPTKSHEYIFLLSKKQKYFYDAEAIQEPVTGTSHARGSGVNPKAKNPAGWSQEPGRHDGVPVGRYRPRQNESFSAAVNDLVDYRNKRSVWTVPTYPLPEAHFATFPPALILPCVLAGCPLGRTILDPFSGAGTTALVAKENGRQCIGIELNEEYIEIAARRLSQEVLPLQAVGA